MSKQRRPPAPGKQRKKSEPEVKKPRSPVERIAVWSGIGALLLILAFEVSSHYRFTAAYDKLSTAARESESLQKKMTDEDILALMNGRRPDMMKDREFGGEDDQYDIYYFHGILKRRVICVHYTRNIVDKKLYLYEVLPREPDLPQKH